MKIVLASKSPRRSEILNNLGLDFEVEVSKQEEIMPEGMSPEDTVMALARQKGMGIDADVVISADTIVVLNGRIMCKPKNEEDAFEMLRALSGNTHSVYTGICVNGECDYEMTRVTFDNMSDDEIWGYIKTGEPMDKAGAYGAQGIGGCFVKSIDGDFFNVMGLPTHRLYKLLSKFGVKII